MNVGVTTAAAAHITLARTRLADFVNITTDNTEHALETVLVCNTPTDVCAFRSLSKNEFARMAEKISKWLRAAKRLFKASRVNDEDDVDVGYRGCVDWCDGGEQCGTVYKVGPAPPKLPGDMDKAELNRMRGTIKGYFALLWIVNKERERLMGRVTALEAVLRGVRGTDDEGRDESAAESAQGPPPPAPVDDDTTREGAEMWRTGRAPSGDGTRVTVGGFAELLRLMIAERERTLARVTELEVERVRGTGDAGYYVQAAENAWWLSRPSVTELRAARNRRRQSLVWGEEWENNQFVAWPTEDNGRKSG